MSKFQVESNKKKEIDKKIKNFELYIKANLPRCNRMLDRFISKHSKWVSSKISITLNERCNTPLKMGRPNCSYTNAGIRLKRKLASDFAPPGFLYMLLQFVLSCHLAETWHSF